MASHAKTSGKTAKLGRPKLSERPPGFSRAELLEAAKALFIEEGYEKSTIRKIAARTGLASGSIYRHFEDKADLLFAVLAQLARPKPLWDTSDATDGVAQAAQGVAAFAEADAFQVRRTGAEVHAAAAREPHAKALLGKFNQQGIERSIRHMERLIERGELPADIDKVRTHQLLLVIITGLSHLDVLFPDLVGDPVWIEFIESTVSDILLGSSWRDPNYPPA